MKIENLINLNWIPENKKFTKFLPKNSSSRYLQLFHILNKRNALVVASDGITNDFQGFLRISNYIIGVIIIELFFQ